jgi:hypothetical protein
MALMSREVYEALREIGVSDEQAIKAAEALAFSTTDFTAMRTDMGTMRTDMGTMRTDIAVLKATLEHLNHRMNLLMTVLFLVLGGVLSTLWVLARR